MDPSVSRKTPIDDNYPSCERTYAELTIATGDLDPSVVSERLHVQPTSTQQKGELRTNSLGRTRTVRLSAWFLSSEEAVVSKDLRRHLDWLLERLAPAVAELRALQGEAGLKMSVNCVWWSTSGQGGPTLWPEQMSRLADLNLECSFDVAFFGNEEDERNEVRS